MPRGMRAVAAGELHQALHHRGARGYARHYTPATEALACACWCGRHAVGVPRVCVRQGVTLSCGRSDCVPPPLVELVVGVRLFGLGDRG